MDINLCYIEVIQFFFMNFAFVCSEEIQVKEKHTHRLILFFMASVMAKIVAFNLNPLVS